MKQEVKSGQTDYTALVLIRDTAGAPKTGLTEASVDIAYVRVETDNDVTCTDVTPAALTALTDDHTDWGFEEVSATDAPGLYRLDLADAVFASGAWSAVVSLTGTGLDPTHLEFVLVPEAPISGVSVASGAIPAIADGLMTRASSNWEASAPVKSLGTAVMKATHRIKDNAGSLEVYRSDGTTVHASQSITTDAANAPIDELSGAS